MNQFLADPFTVCQFFPDLIVRKLRLTNPDFIAILLFFLLPHCPSFANLAFAISSSERASERRSAEFFRAMITPLFLDDRVSKKSARKRRLCSPHRVEQFTRKTDLAGLADGLSKPSF